MNIARQLAKYESKGFTTQRAQVNVMMEAAAFAVFRDFPDAFVLFGGATLVLYHDSVRHSADLDLLSRGTQVPSREQIMACLEADLPPLAEAMEARPIEIEADESQNREQRIYITRAGGERLFRVDLSNLGSAIEGEIESHPVNGAGISVVVKSATKELLLLQKAEAFLLRRKVKVRDAYDIHLLKALGAELNLNLQGHLADTVLANGIDEDTILERIEHINVNRCQSELKPILPADVYSKLEEADFEPLRSGLEELYQQWL